MAAAPTIYLAEWNRPRGYGRSSSAWTLERDPEWDEEGNGRVWPLTPTEDELRLALSDPTACRKAYKQRLHQFQIRTGGGLSPGRLLAWRYAHVTGNQVCTNGMTGAPTFAEYVGDCDTLVARAGRPWRVWAARALAWAGWAVVFDGIPIPPR